MIDTPGMRELQISSADLNSGFSDIEELACLCKFSDCMHESEPKCAVRAAIESGDLSKERLDSYRKLKRELRYQELKSGQLEMEKINNMFGSKNAMKTMKRVVKEKNNKR